jgi:hypothetical protein
VFGGPGRAPIDCVAVVTTGYAVLGVRAQFVFDVWLRATDPVAFKQFDWAEAVFAAKRGVVVDERLGNGFDLPEGLITAANFDTTTFDFTLIDFFAFDWHG